MSARRELLEEAADLVDGDRNAQYGDPRQDFQRTAAMWSAYLGIDIAPHDVAALMVMLKVSRIRWSPAKRDSWVDLVGYAACGWHCAMPEDDTERETAWAGYAPPQETTTECDHVWLPPGTTSTTTQMCTKCHVLRYVGNRGPMLAT